MANTASEEGELSELIETLGNPHVITVQQLREAAANRNMTAVLEFLNDRRTSRAIPHRLDECGYDMVPNPDRPKDGLWPVGTRRTPIYGRRELVRRDQIEAARALSGGHRET
jgi:hypothetical protein